jgi:hypothetical protein
MRLDPTDNFNTVDYLSESTTGKFRFVTKCRAGWLTISDARGFDNERLMKYPETIISGHKKGALHTVEFCPEGSDFYLTVFAKQGKKIKIIDKTILENLTVGIINSMWFNTDLYHQAHYAYFNAKTWADKAYAMNETNLETA